MMRERVAMIRSLEEKFDRPIGILVDLQGPKLRVGLFANGAEELRKGDMFTLDADPTPGDAHARAAAAPGNPAVAASPAIAC